MIENVLDASIVLKWFSEAPERYGEQAAVLEEQFSGGELAVYAPSLLRLEVLNVAGRKWGWDEHRLGDAMLALDAMGIAFRDPDPIDVAKWVARGLSAYDAAYAALAEEHGILLVTDDERLVAAAPEIATALADVVI